MKQYVLIYPTRNCSREIALGIQPAGLWHGRWNGFGGKVEDKETIDKCFIRELKEELSLEIKAMNLRYIDKIAQVHFSYSNRHTKSTTDDFMHVFTIELDKLEGDINNYNKDIISELTWFNNSPEQMDMFPDHSKSKLPYYAMPPTDIYWLPHVLHYHKNPIGNKSSVYVQVRFNEHHIAEYVSYTPQLYEGFMNDIGDDHEEGDLF